MNLFMAGVCVVILLVHVKFRKYAPSERQWRFWFVWMLGAALFNLVIGLYV